MTLYSEKYELLKNEIISKHLVKEGRSPSQYYEKALISSLFKENPLIIEHELENLKVNLSNEIKKLDQEIANEENSKLEVSNPLREQLYKKSYFQLINFLLSTEEHFYTLKGKCSKTILLSGHAFIENEFENNFISFFLKKESPHINNDFLFIKLYQLCNKYGLNIETIRQEAIQSQSENAIEEANKKIALLAYRKLKDAKKTHEEQKLKVILYFYSLSKIDKNFEQKKEVLDFLNFISLNMKEFNNVVRTINSFLLLDKNLSFDDMINYVMADESDNHSIRHSAFLKNLEAIRNGTCLQNHSKTAPFIKEFNSFYQQHIQAKKYDKCQKLQDYLSKLIAFDQEINCLQGICDSKTKTQLLLKFDDSLERKNTTPQNDLNASEIRTRIAKAKTAASLLKTEAHELFGTNRKLLGLSLMFVGGLVTLLGIAACIPLTPVLGIPIKSLGGALILAGASLAGFTGISLMGYSFFKRGGQSPLRRRKDAVEGFFNQYQAGMDAMERKLDENNKVGSQNVYGFKRIEF